MKKAKLVMGLVGVLAVAGGALAFKANRFVANPLYSITSFQGVGTYCTTSPYNSNTGNAVLTTLALFKEYRTTAIGGPSVCTNQHNGTIYTTNVAGF